MYNPKFTDGPWHNKGKRVFWTKPDHNLPKDNLFNGLVCICATTEDNPPEVIEEAHANAALIATAPEMYELLEKWFRQGRRDMRYYFARRINAGFDRERILRNEFTQRAFTLLRRTKLLMKRIREAGQ